nr:hypothetical protein [Endozoicomonas sp.]
MSFNSQMDQRDMMESPNGNLQSGGVRRITSEGLATKPAGNIAGTIKTVQDMKSLKSEVTGLDQHDISAMADALDAMGDPLAPYMKALSQRRVQEPVVEKKVRKATRKRGRYGLVDYYSMFELADKLGIPITEVRVALMNGGVVEHVQYLTSRRFVLTKQGHRIGRAYNPKKAAFVDSGRVQELATNAQPVFTDDVLAFF